MTVALSLFAGVGAQLFTNSGLPLTGGKIYTYQAGTSTPAATYTSSTGGTALPNPIILDSAGRVPTGEIWLSTDTLYKFILRDINDVLIATYDNVGGVSNAGDLSNTTNPALGDALIGFRQSNNSGNLTSAVGRTVHQKLQESVSIKDFGATGDGTTNDAPFIQNAINSTPNGTLLVPVGTYKISDNLDFGSVELVFKEGGLFSVDNTKEVAIRKQVWAGDYQIFSTTGNIFAANTVNPMWWGAVISKTDPGPTVAAANTLAFRRAGKSFYADYASNLGANGYGINWTVDVPAGAFFLSNGFSVPTGVPIRGKGVNSLLCRLTANFDGDTSIALLAVGQTYGPPPTLVVNNDGGSGPSPSPFQQAGYPFTASTASQLYFVDQAANTAAFLPVSAGIQFSNLFFTSCGISISFNGCADLVGNNIIIDLGLSGMIFNSSQNIELSNLILYNINAQAISFVSNNRDITISGCNLEYPVINGIYFVEGQSNNDNIRFIGLNTLMNAQYSGFLGMVHVRGINANIFFDNCSFRNIKGPAINQTLIGGTINRFTFNNCVFDGLATGAYTQGTTMSAFSVLYGKWTFKDCSFEHLFNPSTISTGVVNANFIGMRYEVMNLGTNVAVVDIGNAATGSSVQFVGVVGDAISPLLQGSASLTEIRVKASIDWLGAPVSSGGFLRWTVPAPAGCQYMVTFTARNAAGASERKSGTWIVERSNEYTGAVYQDYLTSALLYRSPQVDPASPVIDGTFVFTGGAATQATAYPGTTSWYARLPSTYVDYKIGVDFLD
jgi:hypothetical protein